MFASSADVVSVHVNAIAALQAMGVNADMLAATIRDYNACCEKGFDELLGKDPKYLTNLGDKGYYAVKARPMSLGAIGGVLVNSNLQVIKEDGTVITPEQVRMTCDAGGHYLVTPATQPEIIRMGKALGLGLYPGALTPTEILTAFEAGADAVKVFPVSTLGPGYIKAVKAPLSHIPLMAVGGVNEKNAADFMKAGCVGLGVGGNLVNKEWIESGQWDKITALAKEFMKAVNEA